MSQKRAGLERAALLGVGGALFVFLIAPLISLTMSTGWLDLTDVVQRPFVWQALRLSAMTTGVSLTIVVGLGTPLAWLLGRSSSSLARTVEAAMQLPLVIPPSVAGVALLTAFGRRGLFSGVLYPEGWSVTFTAAAVVIAQVFVSTPLFVQSATSAFRRVDARVVLVARSLGAGPVRVLLSVGVPLAAPGLVAGAAMCWARALGEFGATLMFAGNLPGQTQTLPLAIYTALENDVHVARALSVWLVLVAFALLVLVRLAKSRSEARR